MLTITFYRNASIDEFKSGSWLKDGAPHVTAFTHAFNKLSAYFIEKILSQPLNNAINGLQFLLELAQALCPLDQEGYPDLNHLMLISSILNNINISRVNSAFKELSSKEQKLIEEINRLVCQEKNSKFMREVYGAYRTALPFLGGLLTSITFAHDGNENNTLLRMEAVGSVLKNLMEIKLLINFRITNPQTDLPAFIAGYVEPKEEQLYNASLRHHPRKRDVIDLDSITNNFTQLLDELEQNYLNNNILPRVLFKETLYPPSQLACKLMELVDSKLRKLDKKPQTTIPERHCASISSFAKLESIINKIVKIYNEFYRPKKFEALSCAEQLAKLKKQIISREQEPRPAADRVEHKRSRSVLHRRLSSLTLFSSKTVKKNSTSTMDALDIATSSNSTHPAMSSSNNSKI